MCILCNTKDHIAGDAFLTEFINSRSAMKSAIDAMAKCSTDAVDAASAKRYDATRRKMIRILREWSRIEEFREHDS